MSGFSVPGTTARYPALFAEANMGEDVFVFVRDSSADGKELRTVTTASLDWVLEMYADVVSGDHAHGVDHLAAYMLRGDQLVPCQLEVAGTRLLVLGKGTRELLRSYYL